MVSIRLLGLLVAVVARVGAQVWSDDKIIAHSGEPQGEEVTVDDLTLYVATPEGDAKDIAVLYLTDVFGIQLLESQLLVDSFARAGFITVAPDLFDGEPAPTDLTTISGSIEDFLAANTADVVDARIEKAIAYLRNSLGIKKIGVTGYCFGGRYAFRFGAEGRGADIVFAAHPSMLSDEEIIAVEGPSSIAASEIDSMLTAERRAEIEGLLQETGHPYQLTLYGGTSHGFGTRANVSDPEQKFAKEAAFWQAVRWFEAW